MATYQTTYGGAPARGLMGQIASEEKCNKISRTVEDAAGVKFGYPVERGSGDHGVVALATAADFVGIAVLNPAVPPSSDNPDAYPENFTGAFMTMGTMYVAVNGAVSAGDPVYWDVADGQYTATATDNLAIDGAVFEQSATSAGDIVEISLKLR